MFPIRDENPNHKVPLVTVTLIAINVMVFLYEFALGAGAEAFVLNWGLIPEELTTGENLPASTLISPLVSLLTSMFLHGGFGHLIGNMWFLWIFGDNIETFLGHVWFLFFYLLTGVAAGLTHVALNAYSTMPTIGASGAVSGVLGAYLVLYPSIRIQTLMVFGWVHLVRVPAIFFLGMWFVLQLLGGMGKEVGIAFGAHVGGFVAGAIIVLLLSRKSGGRPEHRYDPRRLPRGH